MDLGQGPLGAPHLVSDPRLVSRLRSTATGQRFWQVGELVPAGGGAEDQGAAVPACAKGRDACPRAFHDTSFAYVSSVEGPRVCWVTDAESNTPISVLRLEAVRWAIDTLTSRPAHPFFIAYLHIRARGVEMGRMSQISPRWNDLGRLLAVPGGPPGKPYYRPLLSGQVRDRSRYWMNENLAGSWAPSSLREGQPPLRVVDRAGQLFSLREDHASLARHHLLFDQPISVMALAAYLYRNYGFDNTDPPDQPHVLASSFTLGFGFGVVTSSRLRIDPVTGSVTKAQIALDPEERSVPISRPEEADFDILFDMEYPYRSDGWFEDFNTASEVP